jgi:hypothetical protein
MIAPTPPKLSKIEIWLTMQRTQSLRKTKIPSLAIENRKRYEKDAPAGHSFELPAMEKKLFRSKPSKHNNRRKVRTIWLDALWQIDPT